MAHILQIVSGSDVNGAVTYANFLTKRLVADGYKVTILHRNNTWLAEQKIPGVEYFTSELRRTRAELVRIATWCQENQVDLMHTHMSRAHFFGVLLKLGTRLPVVATAHSCRFQLHWALNNFVIANSKATLDYQRRVNRVSRSKSSMAYCFTDLAQFEDVSPLQVAEVRQRLRAPDDSFVVGVVGQVGPRKGQRVLFDCLPELFSRIPNLKVVLLGQYKKETRYVQQLRKLQLKNGWTGRIKWLGRRDNVQDYMHAFDLCVVPSYREPLGLVALEAFAAGTPVVASRTGGLPEIVSHGDNGLLVPVGKTRELTDAIEEMSQCESTRTEMGNRGQEMVKRLFQPKQLTEKVTDVYEQILAAA